MSCPGSFKAQCKQNCPLLHAGYTHNPGKPGERHACAIACRGCTLPASSYRRLSGAARSQSVRLNESLLAAMGDYPNMSWCRNILARDYGRGCTLATCSGLRMICMRCARASASCCAARVRPDAGVQPPAAEQGCKTSPCTLFLKLSNYVGNPTKESVHTYIDTHASMHTYSLCLRNTLTRSRPKVKTTRPEFKKNP